MSDQSVVEPVPASDANLALLGVGMVAAATLASCGGGGGGGGAAAAPAGPANTITSLTLSDTTGAPVTVETIVGTAAGVKFQLDGGAAPTSKPADPGANGAAQSYTFAASNTTGSATVGITINPAPADVATALGGALTSIRASVSSMAFAPSWDELMSYVGLTHAQIVDRMLVRMKGAPAEPYPSWYYQRMLSQDEYGALPAGSPARRAEDARRKDQRADFKAWFFRQMVTSPDPLSERLLLFWHNLFTSSADDLGKPQLIANQSQLYRAKMGGHFGDFVKAMSKDPAMVLYLDSDSNNKTRPNENFARELMELFTLGERTTYDGYDEADVKIVARFFTGYRTSKYYDKFATYLPGHSTGTVTLWGQTHTLSTTDPGADGDWVIDQILAKKDAGNHSYCAIYIVTRLWREFIGDPAASQSAIIALADQFSGAWNWNLTELYRALFNRTEFKAVATRGSRIRAPVELFVGFYRALGVRPTKWDKNIDELAGLDQNLFDPPTVFGWPGGTDWINVKTLVDRHEYLQLLVAEFGSQIPDAYADVLSLLLLPIAPVGTIPAGTVAERAAAYVTDPAYNLR